MKLEEGETICPKCNGKGWLATPDRGTIGIHCQKCDGMGKLDWVEMVIGKGSWRKHRRPRVYTQNLDAHILKPWPMKEL